MAHETRSGRALARYRVLSVLVGLAGLTGCVATQMVGLDVGPHPLVIFVDGERMDEIPPEIELISNRDHTLFFQREGYLSQLIVVRTTEISGETKLEPAQVKLRLRRDTATAPNVSVEVE